MKIVFRIIALPFFVVLALIAALRLWVKYIVNYIKYGGEFVAFTNIQTPTTIQDSLNKLIENQQVYKS